MDPTNWKGSASDIRKCLVWLAENWIDQRDHTNTTKNTAPVQDQQDAVQQVLWGMLKTFPADSDDVVLDSKTGEVMFRTSEALERYVKLAVRREKLNPTNERGKKHLRRESIGGDEKQPPYEQLATRPEFDDSVNRERRAIIQPCVDKLKDRKQRVFIAHYYEGEANESVCNREGITYDNLRQILSRAFAEVRKCVAAKGNTQDMGLI